MRLNIEAIMKLIEERFGNKLVNFVREIQVDYSYANQVLKGHKSSGSKKICDGVITYCKKNNLDYHEYIFF